MFRRSLFVFSFLATSSFAIHSSLAAYSQTNLTSDGFVQAAHTDPNLKNPWGMSFGPTTPFWVSDQHTGVATIYDGTGAPFPTASPLVVTIPQASGPVAGPTGQVFNSTGGFVLNTGGKTGAATFMFANLDGSIAAWNGTGSLTQAVQVVPSTTGSAYTGLAITSNGSGNFLLAANNATGNVDVFDANFAPATLQGNFTDPSVPANLHPFNVTTINGKVYVTYAVPGPEADEEPIGSGAVSVFDTNGNLLQSLIPNGSQVASPWGIAVATSNFGEFSNALLVGNFSDEDGFINAFDANTGSFLGTLNGANGQPINNADLWTLAFGNGAQGSDANALYFTAGIGDEEHGLFARITPSSGPAVPLPPAVVSAPLAAAVGLISARSRRIRRED